MGQRGSFWQRQYIIYRYLATRRHRRWAVGWVWCVSVWMGHRGVQVSWTGNGARPAVTKHTYNTLRPETRGVILSNGKWGMVETSPSQTSSRPPRAAPTMTRPSPVVGAGAEQGRARERARAIRGTPLACCRKCSAARETTDSQSPASERLSETVEAPPPGPQPGQRLTARHLLSWGTLAEAARRADEQESSGQPACVGWRWHHGDVVLGASQPRSRRGSD